MIFDDQEFKAEAVAKAIIEGALYEYCIFRDGDLSGMNLSRCKFVNCDFIEVNLSNITLTGTRFQECTFQSCKMLGFDLSAINTIGFKANFQSCNLSHAVFIGIGLKNASFEDCKLQGADFTDADCSGVGFLSCNFAEAVFDQTNLEKANFTGASGYYIDPRQNKLKGARFDFPHAIGLLEPFGVIINS